MAQPQSGEPAVPTPAEAQQVPAQPQPANPTLPVYVPGAQPPSYGYPPPQPGPYGEPDYEPFDPPQSRRGLLIAIIALALVVVLGGGGVAAYLLTRDTGKGQASPTAAVNGFLTAVYTNQDVTEAARYVCSPARDKAKLSTKINEIKAQNAKYESPTYKWAAPKTEQTRTDEAILSVTITLRTANEQKATETVRIVTTRSNGWWVCDIS
jgi:flagellar basal body-associated protein FliL